MKPKHLITILIPLGVLIPMILALALLAHPAKAGGVVTVCDEAHLREALAGGGTVTFACSGTIVVSNTLTISDTTIIDGQGQVVTISGGNTKRVIMVNAGISLSLNELTIANGYVCMNQNGAGISNSGTLTVTNSAFLYNNAYRGGAIFNDGLTSIVDSTFVNNIAPIGGTIYNLGTLNVSHSNFTGQGGTGGSIQSNGTLLVTDTRFMNSIANSYGGGINIQGGTLTLSDSTFSGGVAVDGGGLYIQDGNVVVRNSTFANNSVTHKGGAIYMGNLGTLTVINSTFTANSATGGGAISIYFNIAPGPTITVTNNTLAGNVATSGGGIDISSDTPQEFTMNLANTIISGNTGGNCAGYAFYDGSGNLSYPDNTCPGINFDPDLGILQGNGGPTDTMALGNASPATDQGTALCPDTDQRGMPRPVDGDRDGQAICDIGAFEYQLFNRLFLPMAFR